MLEKGETEAVSNRQPSMEMGMAVRNRRHVPAVAAFR